MAMADFAGRLGVEAAAAAQRAAASFKVYVAGYPGSCVALVPSWNRLVLRPANPTDPYQRWEKNVVVSDNSVFDLVNRGSGRTIMNAHILPPILVGSAQFHPRLLRATARWEEGVAVAGADADGGVDMVCVSVMRNHYLPLRIAPWGQESSQQGNMEMAAAQAGDEVVVAAALEAENDVGAASDEDYAGAGAGEGDDAAPTATASTGRLRRLFPCI